ncbi:MAG: nfsA [Burkholderiaceae bacterium]|nr:nfsA [Burkholderiaceae bacterium]
MNAAMQVLLAHRSYRDFTDQPVSDADLDAIIEAAQRAPSSIHAQVTSLIVVRDPAKRAKIAEIAGNQPWIAKAPVFICLVADFAKTNAAVEFAGEQQVIHESLEGFAVGAIDAGLVLMTLTTAARAMGLGAVMIGGIRNDPQAMIDLLGLPPMTFPFIGCCIGHFASEPPLKPRLPVKTFRHDEQWHGVPDKATIEAYNAELMEYWKSIGRPDGLPWTANTAKRYKQVYFPKTKLVATKQGFTVDK